MSGTKKVGKDQYLFRDGDPPDALYVIKTGKLAVVKAKQAGEITLAEIGPGAMVGEMAFFDNKPRSASVKALKDSEVITLPYKSLHAQFASFPEWAKAIMRTVNTNLRDANQKIKQFEKTDGDTELFPPHTINKLIGILSLVCHRYAKKEEDGWVVPFYTLRKYTIQIFHEPTHKMEKMLVVLSDIKLVKLEDKGDGTKRICILNNDLLFAFVEWYNEWLFKKEEDRITMTEPELKIAKGALHFAKKIPKDAKGEIKLNLTTMQNDSMKELNFLLKVDDFNTMIEKKIFPEKIMGTDGIYFTMKMEDLEKIIPFWEIIYGIKKASR